MDQSAKLEEQSSLVLVVWGQNSGQREILNLKKRSGSAVFTCIACLYLCMAFL